MSTEDRVLDIGASCAKCKFHSMTEREKVIDVADDDLELMAVDENVLERVYVCQHPNRPGREAGIGPTAGRDCELFTLGSKRGLDPALEKLLSNRSTFKREEER